MRSFVRTIYFIFLIPCFSFCEKPIAVIEEDAIEKEIEIVISEEIKPAIEHFHELTKSGDGQRECFLFFTDPHLLKYFDVFDEELKNNLVSFFSLPKEIYDYLSLNFCLSGGDWLNHKDTQEVAEQKLIYADKYMKSLFSNYHKIMGNHDTNYQGVVSKIDSSRGDLPRSFIDNEYFSETGSAYYSFMGGMTKFYVLDSELDCKTVMNEYRWEQVLWLANELLRNENEHLVLCTHMLYSFGKLVPMSEIIVSLCDAYNLRQEINLKDHIFDYSSSKGTIHFILSGHNHEDVVTHVGKNEALPTVQTCNFSILKTAPTFDVCLIDYDEGFLNMIRVGKGKSRQIKLFVQ